MRDLDAAKILAALLKTLEDIDPEISLKFEENLSKLDKNDLGTALAILRSVLRLAPVGARRIGL